MCCTFFFTTFCTLGAAKSLTERAIETQQGEKTPWKKHQIGRERPHFFGLQPPK